MGFILVVNFIWIFVGIIYVIFKLCNESDIKFFIKNIFISKPIPNTLEEKKDVFHKCGYPVSDDAVKYLMTAPKYKKKNLKGDVYSCYTWLCQEYIDSVSKLNDEQLSNEIGVPINSVLKNELTLNETRSLARDFILRKDGLRLDRGYFQSDAMFLKRDLIPLFSENVDKNIEFKQKIKDRLLSSGYNLKEQYINRIAFDSESPINSVYIDTPTHELYSWICLIESNKLRNISNDELSNILGIPINLIPLNKLLTQSDAIITRLEYIRHFILKEDNLEYKCIIYNMNDIEINDYYISIVEFIKKYKCEHY